MADTSSLSSQSGYQSTSAVIMGPQHALQAASMQSREDGGQTVQINDAAAQYSSRFSDSCSNTKSTCSTPQTAHASSAAAVDDDTDASFSQFAQSSRTNLKSLMNSAHPKAIDWTALHAEQLQHYQRLTERRSSESSCSQMDLIHEGQDEDDHGPGQRSGQNASWSDEHISQQNSSTYGPTESRHGNLASGSSSANAFLSILNSPPTTSVGATCTTVPTTGTSTTANTSTLYGRGGLTLSRRPSSKALSSTSSSVQLQQQRGTTGASHQSQPSLSRVRSDQWLDYRRRLEAATGVPMVTSKRDSAGGLGLTRSASKRGLVLSKSTSRSNLMLSKSTSTSRPSLLALAGRASQSNSARSLGSQTSATSTSTGVQSLTPNSSMCAAGAGGGGISPSSSMVRASSFCKKMSLKDTPLK